MPHLLIRTLPPCSINTRQILLTTHSKPYTHCLHQTYGTLPSSDKWQRQVITVSIIYTGVGCMACHWSSHCHFFSVFFNTGNQKMTQNCGWVRKKCLNRKWFKTHVALALRGTRCSVFTVQTVCLFLNQYWGLVKCQSWDHVDSGTRHQASAPSNPPPGTAPLSLTTLLPWAPNADKTQSGIEPRSPAVKGHGTAGLSLAGSRAGAPQLLLEAGQVGLVQTAHKILITLWRTEQFIKHYGAF